MRNNRVYIIFIILIHLELSGQIIKSDIYLPEEYFVAEIESDSLVFINDQSIEVYNNYNLDSLSNIINISDKSRFEISKVMIHTKPGLCIILADTNLYCTIIDKEKYFELEYYSDWENIQFSKGDTVNYYSYMGEGEYLIGIGEYKTAIQVESYKDRLIDILKEPEIINDSKFIRIFNGWISPCKGNVERIRRWVKYY